MTPETMESLLEFCMGKIPDEDLMTLHEMLAKGVSDKAMATDASIKRRTRLAMDCQSRGYKVVRKRVAMDVAQDRDAILAMHPHMFRIADGSNVGFVKPMPAKRSRPMTAAEKAESEAAFPHMFKKH